MKLPPLPSPPSPGHWIVSFFILAVQSGYAQSTATATLTSGGANFVNITPGQSFTLSLGVTTNFISSGYTVFYQAIGGPAPPFFQITARSNTSPINPDTGMPVFTFPTIDPFPVPFPYQFDLGAFGDQTHNQPPGTFSLHDLTIMALPSAVPGSYSYRLDPRSIMTDRTGGGFFDVNMGGASGPTFTINVIPEPNTVGLVALGGTTLFLMARRRRRAAA